ncbi:acetyl-CoA-benzylalcohol acetyltransferase-like [Vitis riparia]|uniref:acetyl-CoA-benzylalcohol acetyltransferase-like n=1 Tax=Vitis riparia TaxID=96939 RepID=UPI00155A91C8|nr:acetyl-CoA-benzylalcohol acetyltransferase-like [Vitis riparia]
MNSLIRFDFGVVGSVTSPLVVIQTTLFECGGLVIGICICHAIADGFIMVKFITSWATASQVGTKELLLPCFNLASLFSAKVLPMLKPPPPPRVFGLDKVVTRQFVCDGAEISILKARSSPGSCDVGVKPKPSLKHNYCGYLYRLVAARFMGDRSKMELPDLVVLLRDAIYVNALCCEDVFPTVVKSFNKVNEESKKEYVDVHMFTSWCRFPTYEADFGWEKPT